MSDTSSVIDPDGSIAAYVGAHGTPPLPSQPPPPPQSNFDPAAQAHYARLRASGYLAKNPKAAALAAQLVKDGVLKDLSQTPSRPAQVDVSSFAPPVTPPSLLGGGDPNAGNPTPAPLARPKSVSLSQFSDPSTPLQGPAPTPAPVSAAPVSVFPRPYIPQKSIPGQGFSQQQVDIYNQQFLDGTPATAKSTPNMLANDLMNRIPQDEWDKYLDDQRQTRGGQSISPVGRYAIKQYALAHKAEAQRSFGSLPTWEQVGQQFKNLASSPGLISPLDSRPPAAVLEDMRQRVQAQQGGPSDPFTSAGNLLSEEASRLPTVLRTHGDFETSVPSAGILPTEANMLNQRGDYPGKVGSGLIHMFSDPENVALGAALGPEEVAGSIGHAAMALFTAQGAAGALKAAGDGDIPGAFAQGTLAMLPFVHAGLSHVLPEVGSGIHRALTDSAIGRVGEQDAPTSPGIELPTETPQATQLPDGRSFQILKNLPGGRVTVKIGNRRSVVDRDRAVSFAQAAQEYAAQQAQIQEQGSASAGSGIFDQYAQTNSRALPPGASASHVGINGFEDYRDAIQSTFGLDDQQAHDAATLVESRARAWAQENNKPVEDFYRAKIAGITQTGPGFANDLAVALRGNSRTGGFPGESDRVPQTGLQGFQDYAGKYSDRPDRNFRATRFNADDTRAVIGALSSPDVSTAAHEFAHVFRATLSPSDLAPLEKWAGVENGEWGKEAEEKFATSYEQWLKDGNAPNPSLQGTFTRFKDYLARIYGALTRVVGKRKLDALPFSPEVMDMLARAHADVSDITGEGAPPAKPFESDPLAPVRDNAAGAIRASGIANPTPEQQTLAEKATQWGRKRQEDAASQWQHYELVSHDPRTGETVIRSPRNKGDQTAQPEYTVNVKTGESSDPDSAQHLNGQKGAGSGKGYPRDGINRQLAAAGIRQRVVSKHVEIARNLVEQATGTRPDGPPDTLFQNGENDNEQHDQAAIDEQQAAARQVSGPGQLRGGPGVLARAPGADTGNDSTDSAASEDASRYTTPLKGLQGSVSGIDIPGYGKVKPAPFAIGRRAAEEYTRQAGIDYDPPKRYVKVDPERATRIANAFDQMAHAPDDPEVKASYDAMMRETLAQYQAIKKTGLHVEFIRGEDPYKASPRLMTEDVRNNNHMWVFPTDDGFGGPASQEVDISGNPLLGDSGETISGRRAMINDIFRVVHDYFGHVKEGVGFRADGEENAWQSHAAMYTPEARRAMTSETRGQNSWVNFGPFAESNKTASAADTEYAPQKIGLMPQWASEEGKETGGKQPLFQNADPEDQPAPGFYSQLRRVVDEKMTDKMSAGRVRALFGSNGVKGDEVKATGLDRFLDEAQASNTPVSKETVQNFLDDQQVRLGPEVVKKREAKSKTPFADKGIETLMRERAAEDAEREPAWEVFSEDHGLPAFKDTTAEERIEAYLKYEPDFYRSIADQMIDVERRWAPHGGMRQEEGPNDPKWESYGGKQLVLPGGKNYQEKLLTLPPSDADLALREKLLQDNADAKAELKAAGLSENSTAWQIREKLGDEAYHRISTALMTNESNVDMVGNDNYNSSHWDEANVLAHIRHNDRTGPNGEKLLHLEEVQSDWHQEGRKKGYRQPGETPETARAAIDTAKAALRAWKDGIAKKYDGWPGPSKLTDQEISEQTRLRKAVEAASDRSRMLPTTPSAPFAESWHQLALRRMIGHAAENGYDKITWTPGADQADRYDLSHNIEGIAYQPSTGELYIHKKGQGDYDAQPIARNVTSENLADHIGIEPAKNLLSTELDDSGYHEITGQDLKVGGRGMKGFYDDMIPNYLDAYAKKNGWSSRVGTTQIDTPGYEGGDKMTVPSFDITPEMRQDVTEKGQVLFQNAERPEQENGPGLPSDFVSARHLKAVVDAARGNMEKISPSAFSRAIQESPHAAGLSQYTPDEAKGFERYRLPGTKISYGIKPVDQHDITGKPEKDIVGVVNNEGKALPSVATPAVMLHAIEQGATTLDAWDVGGFLPSLYGRYGFKEIGYSPYDVAEYGEPGAGLKAAWRKAGWKDGDPYPGVRYMKYGGIDGKGPDRSRARSNYLRSGTVDAPGGVQAAVTQAASLLDNDGRTSGPARVGPREGVSPGAEGRAAQGNSGESGQPVGTAADRASAKFLAQVEAARSFSPAERKSFGVAKVDKPIPHIFDPENPYDNLARTADDLRKGAEENKTWRTWYDEYESTLRSILGDDAPLFQKFLSATSQAASVPANVGLALKAFSQHLSGEPFTGYLEGVRNNLNRVVADESLQGLKISQYGAAVGGDEGGIAVDRHVAQLLFDTQKPSPIQIEHGKAVIRSLASEFGWQPREMQAALWALNQTRKGDVPRSYDTYLLKKQKQIDALRAKFPHGDRQGDGVGQGTGGEAAVDGQATDNAGGQQSATSGQGAAKDAPEVDRPALFQNGTRHIPDDPRDRYIEPGSVHPLKQSTDRYLMGVPDAHALTEDAIKNNLHVVTYLYDPTAVGKYPPIDPTSPLWRPEDLDLDGGHANGQMDQNYGKILGASEKNATANMQGRADQGGKIVLIVNLGKKNARGNRQAGMKYGIELADTVRRGEANADDLDEAVRFAAKKAGVPEIQTLDDYIAEMRGKQANHMNTIPKRKAFVDALQMPTIQKKYGVMPIDEVLDRMTDYGDRGVGEVIGAGRYDDVRRTGPGGFYGDAENHTFKYNIPGVHVGDVRPGVHIGSLMRDNLHAKWPKVMKADGSFDLRSLMYGLQNGMPLLDVKDGKLERLAHEDLETDRQGSSGTADAARAGSTGEGMGGGAVAPRPGGGRGAGYAGSVGSLQRSLGEGRIKGSWADAGEAGPQALFQGANGEPEKGDSFVSHTDGSTYTVRDINPDGSLKVERAIPGGAKKTIPSLPPSAYAAERDASAKARMTPITPGQQQAAPPQPQPPQMATTNNATSAAAAPPVPPSDSGTGKVSLLAGGRYRNSYAHSKNLGDALNTLAGAEMTARSDAHYANVTNPDAIQDMVNKAKDAATKKVILALRNAKDANGAPIAVFNDTSNKLPREITVNGVKQRAVEVNLGEVPSKIARKYDMRKAAVPAGVASDLDDALGNTPYKEPSGPEKALQKLAGFSTSLQLLTPAEFINHVKRVTDLASTVPPDNYSVHQQIAENIVPYLGPRLGFLYRAASLDFNTPEVQGILHDIMAANGGSNRGLRGHDTPATTAVGRGIQKAAGFSHNLLFGLPEGKGVKGFDIRTRVALESIRRHVEGNTDPQRIRDFANQFGQYVEKVDPSVEFMRKLNPFSATSLPMRVTEMRQMTGDSGFKGISAGKSMNMRAQSLWRKAGGTALMFTAANMMLSGHPPWQNDDSHKLDLELPPDKDGKKVYIKGTALMPTITRALRDSGVIPAMEASAMTGKGAPRTTAGKAALATERTLGNNAMSMISSPLSNTMLTATTGNAAYLDRTGKPLDITDKKFAKTHGKSLANLRAAALNMNSVAGNLIGKGDTQTPGDFDNNVYKVLSGIQLLGGKFLEKDERSSSGGGGQNAIKTEPVDTSPSDGRQPQPVQAVPLSMNSRQGPPSDRLRRMASILSRQRGRVRVPS